MLKDVVLVESLEWPFEQPPQFRIGWGSSTYPVKADPFPCYAHDIELVRKIAGRVERIFPIGREVIIYCPRFDVEGRTNGFTQRGWDWSEEVPRPWNASIVLAGKRIPLHPAMTRYLVTHEYGHVAEYWIEQLRGYKQDRNEIHAEYAKIRGENKGKFYGGGQWHAQLGEVFANDFRILVCEAEEEFWPHPDYPRPEDVPAVREWWEAAVKLTRATAYETSQKAAA